MLNGDITLDEVQSVIRRLKRNKSSGLDLIENDYLIDSCDFLGDFYVSFFFNIIRPLYNRKGDPGDPNSYRPITIISCLGTLFTCLLNSRLNHYLDINNIFTEVWRLSDRFLSDTRASRNNNTAR